MIPSRMKRYLDRHHIQYQTVSHQRTKTLEEAAQVLGLPLTALAKAVLLIDQDGVFSVAMIPFTAELDLVALSALAGRPMGIVFSPVSNHPFIDCEPGSHPPIGEPYHLETFIDGSLRDFPEVTFEVGSHSCLVHVQQDDFQYLMADALCGQIIHRPIKSSRDHASFFQKILAVAREHAPLLKKKVF